MKPHTVQAAEWIDPAEHRPPMGAKILLLTQYGTAIIGVWQEGCIAWAGLPKIPAHIKAKIGRRNDGN